MLRLIEAIDQLAMANSVCVYGHVLRSALNFEIEGQRKMGSLKQVMEDSMKVWLSWENEHLPSKWFGGITRIAIKLR